mgnify:CR=1 FL=1
MMFRILMSLILLLSLSSCSRDQHGHPSNITNKQLFEIHCAECHTPSGTGSILLGVPANKDTKLLNYQIRQRIIEGAGGNSKMPVFHDMPEEEANRIITYLRGLSR